MWYLKPQSRYSAPCRCRFQRSAPRALMPYAAVRRHASRENLVTQIIQIEKHASGPDKCPAPTLRVIGASHHVPWSSNPYA